MELYSQPVEGEPHLLLPGLTRLWPVGFLFARAAPLPLRRGTSAGRDESVVCGLYCVVEGECEDLPRRAALSDGWRGGENVLRVDQ